MNTKKVRIIVIDKLYYTFLQTFLTLQDAGYEVVGITTLEKAWDTDLTCDLILLSLRFFPDEDFEGIAFLRDLRNVEVTSPVAIFSFVDPERVQERLEDLQVLGYLHRPVHGFEIVSLVEGLLAKIHQDV